MLVQTSPENYQHSNDLSKPKRMTSWNGPKTENYRGPLKPLPPIPPPALTTPPLKAENHFIYDSRFAYL